MATYFTLAELLKSNTAKQNGIDNTPTFEVVRHLEELTEKILDPLRAAWGKPIRVKSGYRCPRLNAAVGGSKTSVHMIGYAADLQTSGSFRYFGILRSPGSNPPIPNSTSCFWNVMRKPVINGFISAYTIMLGSNAALSR